MSSFGQELWQGFTNVNSLRDYTHASRTFRTNAYELKPRFKFLFHVSFTINIQEIPALRGALPVDDVNNISLLVKTIDLPKFNIETETLNQYNRKRVVQKRINYEPINITFHDDGGDVARNMWYQYYSYYYKDPSQRYDSPNNTNGSLGSSANRAAGFGYNARDIYSDQRVGNVNDWGYIGEAFNDGTSSASGKPPFFRDIRIYGMDQHKFAEYILINPIISNWSHDQYNYSEGAGTMQNSMTIAYETVKYSSGAISASRPDVNVAGFADPAHYDTTRSPIAREGSTATIFGQGGVLDTAAGILEDLESGSVLGLIGAAQKAGTAYNTLKGKDLKSIAKNETVALGQQAIIGSLPAATRAVANKADGWIFPNATFARNNAGENQSTAETNRLLGR